MRLSVFTVADEFPPEARGRDRYRELLELATACEEAGLSTFWVAEHHFHPGGVVPAPPILLAAAGAQTQRLRLGVLVSPLPFHAPIDLAEQYALLDRLTGGRLELGVGSGYIPLEFEGFGLRAEEKRARFDHHLEVLLRALRGDPVRSDGASREVTINVAPIQRPHPPLRVAAQRREALPFLARAGRSIALIPYATVSGLEELAAEIREYRAALPAGRSGDVAAAVHVYVGEHAEEARRAFQGYLDSRRSTQSPFYEAKVHADPHLASAAAIEAQGLALFGTAAEVGAHLHAWRAAGVDELLAIVDFGGLAAGRVRESVRALGELRGSLA